MIEQSVDPISIPGSRIRVIYHSGALANVGEVARSLGGKRVLLVTDQGIKNAGHLERAMRSLYSAGIVACLYDGVEENPTTKHVYKGLLLARKFEVDLIIGLGGGSSMDCAKGINFLYTNEGRMEDYWGVNKAKKEMLPLIAIPTTSGTGSEAQSAALITDPDTHVKMACWDEKAAAKIAILDPELTVTQPWKVAAATGIDAISHAVETAASTKRNAVSLGFSREAWGLLSGAFGEVLGEASSQKPVGSSGEGSGFRVQGSGGGNSELFRSHMLLGAHLAGCAIENSMLGAGHACANPLTAKSGIVHGHAVGVMLPHVVRFNCLHGGNAYSEIAADWEALVERLTGFLKVAKIPVRLSGMGVDESALEEMAEMAAGQWTAGFNPVKVGAGELLSIYRAAY